MGGTAWFIDWPLCFYFQKIVGATEEVEDEEIIEHDESENTMTLSGHFLQMPDGTLVKAEADTEIDFEDNIIYR